jgi:hypothetical protein
MENKPRWIQNMIAEAAKQEVQLPFDRKTRRAKRLERLQRQGQLNMAATA